MYCGKVDMCDMYVWLGDYGKDGARSAVRIVLCAMSITPLDPGMTGSVLDEDALEEDDLDVDARRHFDDGLVLLCALDQIFADHVGRLRDTAAEAALRQFADSQLLALAVHCDVGAVQNSIRVG